MIKDDMRKRLEDYSAYRARHHNHTKGETLYYYCEHSRDIRSGVVYQTVEYCPLMTYYILEVDACGLGMFLELRSEFQVSTEDEL